MGKKKILLVSNGFYPEISPRSFRATELAKEFYRQGHDVTVISKYRDHDYSAFLNEFPITFKMLNKPVLPRIPEFKTKPFSFLFRILSRLLAVYLEYPGIEEMFLLKKRLRHESGYDLMISIAVPYTVHWGVAKARSEKHKIADTWVADCGDPYMGDILDSIKKPFYFKYLEKSFSRKADFISIPVESAKPAYYSEFHHKIMIIPQGLDFDLSITKSDNKKRNDFPEFAYAGSFLKGIRDPIPLVKFLLTTDIPFKFYVFTNQQELFYEFKEVLNGKLIVSGYIPREELLRVLSRMDFLINLDNDTTLNIPSKLIDYIVVNRPVLNIDKNFDTEDLLAFLKGDYIGRMSLPKPEQYHIKNVTRQFLGLLDNIKVER